MPDPISSSAKTADLPAKVFEQFLADLATANASADVVARLRKALVEDRVFTEAAMRKAVLGEDVSQ